MPLSYRNIIDANKLGAGNFKDLIKKQIQKQTIHPIRK